MPDGDDWVLLVETTGDGVPEELSRVEGIERISTAVAVSQRVLDGAGAVASGLWRVGVYRVGGSPRVASLWLAAEAAANLDPLLPPPLAPGEAPNIRAQLVRGTFDGCGGDSLAALGAGRLRVAQRLRLSVESGKEAADDGRRLAS